MVDGAYDELFRQMRVGAVAVELGLIERAALQDYGGDGALLEAISSERTPLVDLTSGSLGQGYRERSVSRLHRALPRTTGARSLFSATVKWKKGRLGRRRPSRRTTGSSA